MRIPQTPPTKQLTITSGPLVSSPQRKALVHSYAIALERNPLTGIEQLLKRSTVPARIVWGTADKNFPSKSPDYLSRVFGNSRGMRRLEGKKLFFPEELSDIIADEARRLWAGR
jgi:haloalkane dehalogenase